LRFKQGLLHACLPARQASSIAFVLLVLYTSPGFAVCKGTPHNPLTEVCWQCMKAPVCICPFPPPIFFRIGIPVSFWEPARFIESVKDAFCFPSLGLGLTPFSPGFLNGGGTEGGTEEEAPSAFQQTHYAIYPVYTLMEILTDFTCIEHSGFDIASPHGTMTCWLRSSIPNHCFLQTFLPSYPALRIRWEQMRAFPCPRFSGAWAPWAPRTR